MYSFSIILILLISTLVVNYFKGKDTQLEFFHGVVAGIATSYDMYCLSDIDNVATIQARLTTLAILGLILSIFSMLFKYTRGISIATFMFSASIFVVNATFVIGEFKKEMLCLCC